VAPKRREAKSNPHQALPRARRRPVVEEASRPESAAPFPIVAIGASEASSPSLSSSARCPPIPVWPSS
jgi:hypothetical protein